MDITCSHFVLQYKHQLHIFLSSGNGVLVTDDYYKILVEYGSLPFPHALFGLMELDEAERNEMAWNNIPLLGSFKI